MDARPVRILHIDDDPALVRLIAKSFARHGLTVENAADADAGLSRIADGGLDAIILDHYLPSGNGLTILNALRDQPGAPPIVYMTGSADAALAVEALKAGAADYVLKSVGEDFISLLLNAVQQAITKDRLHQAKEQAEQEVRAARDRAVLLLAEVNHRVANSLALVAALVRMQASALADPVAKGALEETQARISAIANLHRSLYTSEDVRSVALDDYLRTLVSELDTSLQDGGDRSRVRLALDPYAISTDKAVSVGMIVTELLTNAYKYAYPDGQPGEIEISLKTQGDGTAVLCVADHGIGWDGEGPAKGTGLGSRIVKAMASTIGSTLNYGSNNGGTRATLNLG